MNNSFSELRELGEKSGLLKAVTGFCGSDLREKAAVIAKVMLETVQEGLNTNELSQSGLCGFNTALLKKQGQTPLVTPFAQKAMLYSLAIIEQNARMGKIAACPTAGSSGIVPGVLIAAKEEFNKSFDEFLDALIMAGECGRIISIKMQLAGAVAGCQAECGAASGMASFGLSYMLGFDIDTIFNSAALNLKNLMGLVCDPVAGLVEIPCVKRNVLLTSHAINSVYLAQAGIKSSIPLDEVIDAMNEVGMLTSPKLKESSEAGLAATKTGIEIRNRLYKNWHG